MTPDERRVYKLIADKLASRVDDTAAAIASGDYTRIDTDLRKILTDEVAQAVLRAGAARVTPIAGIPDAQSKQMVEQALSDVRNSYIDTYWNPFLQDLSDTEREYISRVVQQAQTTVGYTTDDIRNALSMFGDLRAQRIAFTEPTRASAQQMNALQQVATNRGVMTQRVWRNIADFEVCDECIEYDGQTEADGTWAVDYPAGPPAHVNCRCIITLQLVPSQITEGDTSALPAVPEPQQELPLLDRTASQIADHIIDAVPDAARGIIADIADIKTKMQQISMDIKQTKDARRKRDLLFNYSLNASALALKKQALNKAVNYEPILTQLQSDKPQRAAVTFDAAFTKAEQDRIQRYIELTVGMAKQRADGTPITIDVQVNTSRGDAGSYDPTTRIMRVNRNADDHVVVHETLHAMQDQIGYGVTASDVYGDARTAGYKPTRDGGYLTYKGITDDDYAFRQYTKIDHMGKYCEIIPTTIGNIGRWASADDRGIIDFAIQVIKDYSK